MSAEEPDLNNLTKNIALKIESDQISALAEGNGTLLRFNANSDDEDTDSEYGEDTEDEEGNLENIRPDRRKRVYTHDDQTKQTIIKTEVMALTEDIRTCGIKSSCANYKKDYADSSELEVEPNQFASRDEEEYKAIHARYANLGKYNQLLQSGNFITLIDKMVYKNPIRQGTGPCVDENSTVVFDCACWTENCHEPYDSTWLRKKAVVAELSTGALIPGFKIILKTMRKSEKCEGIIRPEYAFKELGVPPRIPKNATIFCVIQVLRIYEDSSLAKMLISPNGAQQAGVPFKAFISVCNDARMLGNYYLRKGDPWKALERYRSARTILDSLTFKDEQEEDAANSILIKLYNNSSNALLQLNKPRTTLTFCKLALELDSYNVKAHWFYVRAWEMLRHFDRALKWAHKGLAISGSYRTNFIMKIEKLKLDLKREKKMQSELMRKMGSCFN